MGGDGQERGSEGLKKTNKRIQLGLGETLLSEGETVPQPISQAFVL